MLLYNLPLPKATNTRFLKSVTYMCNIAKQIVNKKRRYNLGILFGVSGCGKTRSFYELLCKHYGLFFVVESNGEPGSPDMKCFREKVSSLAAAEDDIDKREEVAKFYIRSLICARLLLLKAVLTYYSKDMRKEWLLPIQWLYLQRNLQRIEIDHENFIVKVFEMLLKCDQNQVKDTLKQSTTWFMKRKKTNGVNLFILVDEAHMLMDYCKDKFTGGTQYRSLFSKFFRTLNDFPNVTVVLAGTSFRLSNAIELINSCIGKVKDTDTLLFTDFYRFIDASHFDKYVPDFLQQGTERKLIRETFRGRPRFVAYFLHYTLISRETERQKLRTDSIQKAADFLMGNDITAIGGQLQQLMPNPSSERPPLVKSMSGENVIDIMELLRRLVIVYELTGGKLILPYKCQTKLVDIGICHLIVDKSTPTVAGILETLVVKAVKTFLEENKSGLTSSVKELLSNPISSPSFRGQLVEHLLPKWIVRAFGSLTLDRSSLFNKKNYKGNPPSWLKKCSVIQKDLKITSYDQHKSFHLDDYLNKMADSSDKNEMFLPEKEAGPDLVFVLQEQGTNNKRLGLLQSKYFCNNIDSTTALRALETTDWNKLFYSKKEGKGNIRHSRKDGCLKLCENSFSAKKGTLRIIFAFPQLTKNAPARSETVGKDAVLVIDKGNMDQFGLTKDEIELLEVVQL